jgi:hypothetical protein
MSNDRIGGRAIALAMALLCLASHTQAQDMYASQHALLAAAIRTGQASGILGGPAADQFRRQFGGTMPLRAEAKVIAAYTRGDCKRIAVVYRYAAPGDSARGEAVLRLELNYCLDGPPPAQLEPK